MLSSYCSTVDFLSFLNGLNLTGFIYFTVDFDEFADPPAICDTAG